MFRHSQQCSLWDVSLEGTGKMVSRLKGKCPLRDLIPINIITRKAEEAR